MADRLCRHAIESRGHDGLLGSDHQPCHSRSHQQDCAFTWFDVNANRIATDGLRDHGDHQATSTCELGRSFDGAVWGRSRYGRHGSRQRGFHAKRPVLEPCRSGIEQLCPAGRDSANNDCGSFATIESQHSASSNLGERTTTRRFMRDADLSPGNKC